MGLYVMGELRKKPATARKKHACENVKITRVYLDKRI